MAHLVAKSNPEADIAFSAGQISAIMLILTRTIEDHKHMPTVHLRLVKVAMILSSISQEFMMVGLEPEDGEPS